jgi:DNA-binding Lrp family transcriptional regulator|tara:strand:+ start:207 stop:641 length:435 start_codon:yes stop_codon:yes gene_type:complete
METTLKNSINAYSEIKPKLSEKRRQIFELIQTLGKATPQELVEMFNDSNINYNLNVASRFTELREAGLIKIIGNRLNNKSNKFNAIYAVTTEEERIDIINQKYQELIDLKNHLINDLNLKISFWTKLNVIKELKKINYKISKLK